jgi:hypothetical protein
VIKILYWFFRWQTGITAAALPPAESDIRRNGFAAVAERAFALGMVRSVVYRKQNVEAVPCPAGETALVAMRVLTRCVGD